MKNTLVIAAISIALTHGFFTFYGEPAHDCDIKPVVYDKALLEELEQKVAEFEESTASLEYYTQKLVNHINKEA